MDNEFKTEKVLLKKEKLLLNIEQLIETDLSLPDYCGDIVKILCCSAQTNIFSATVTGDKAVIDGSIITRVMYIDAAGKTEIYFLSYPFNRSIDVKNACDGDIVDVSCVSEQISCRAVNQRRADIRGSVTLRICVSGAEECSFITNTPKGLCHTLQTSASGKFLKCCSAKSFTLTAQSQPDDKFRNAKIARVSTIPVVNEIKTIKNKMMIRGNVAANITILTAASSFICERVNIPVNQIIDIDGIDEDSDCNVKLKVSGIDVNFSPDTPAAPPYIEASAVLCAEIDAFKSADITAVAEAYSPKCELLCETGKINCVTSVIRINENHTVTAKHDFSSSKPSSVADVAVKKIRYTVHTENKTVMLKGNIHLGIILVCDESEKLYFERITDFEYKKQINEEITDSEFSPLISLNSIDYAVDPDGSVNITTELRIDGCLYISKDIVVITCVEKGEEKTSASSDSVITVYFASKGERLWDIAKEHNTCTDMIKELNGLNDDILTKDCMLVFEQE